MKVNLRLGLVLGLASLALVACKEDGEKMSSDKPQDQFSSKFASAFDAKSSAEPIDPKTGDAKANKETGDPIDF